MDEPGVSKVECTLREKRKALHRSRLLESAMNTLAHYGLAGASVSRILDHANLSRGMINLHFSSKQNLFVEVARHLSDEYAQNWKRATAKTRDNPASRLRAIFAADFNPHVLNQRNTAIWFAFRSAVKIHPEFLCYIDSRDSRLQRTILETCTALNNENLAIRVNPKRATNAFIALLEGMWNDFHLHPNRFDRDEAMAVCLQVAAAFYPNQSWR